MRFTLCLPAFAFACSGLAFGQVVNIDFDEFDNTAVYQGQAAAFDPAGGSAIWNRVSGNGVSTISGSNLKDSFGSATTVGISLAIQDSYLSVNGQQELGGAGGTYSNLMGDYVYISSAAPDQIVSRAGTITGLDAGQLYEVYFYGQGNNFVEAFAEGQNTLFTIGTTSKQTSWDGVDGGNGTLTEDIEYVKFMVTAGIGGQIAFNYANVVGGAGGNVPEDFDGQGSIYGVINGIQIVPVPEPSAALLSGIGFLALLRRRR